MALMQAPSQAALQSVAWLAVAQCAARAQAHNTRFAFAPWAGRQFLRGLVPRRAVLPQSRARQRLFAYPAEAIVRFDSSMNGRRTSRTGTRWPANQPQVRTPQPLHPQAGDNSLASLVPTLDTLQKAWRMLWRHWLGQLLSPSLFVLAMPVEDAPRNRSSGTWRVQHRRPMQPALWRQCTLAVPTASAPELSRRVHRRDRRVQVLGSNCGNGLPRP